VRVHPRQGRELARSLHRLVRIEHARGFARPEYRPQCHRCGASQDNSPFAFVLDVSAIRHFSAEDRRRPPSPS
jgi:hypothetical protein